MKEHIFTTRGHSVALEHAVKELKANGWVHRSDAKIVILPVPSFDSDGHLKGGGTLDDIPTDCVIVGGNLDHPALKKHACVDLLKDSLYLSENAAITAYCAICIAMKNLPVILQDCPILVAGWGRIGKCLVRLLRLLGAKITVAARSEADRALTEALGYSSVDIHSDSLDLSAYRVIFNTIPAKVFPEHALKSCQDECVKIDLASVQGFAGKDIIWARGLPNLNAPESSGKLIAKLVRKEFEA